MDDPAITPGAARRRGGNRGVGRARNAQPGYRALRLSRQEAVEGAKQRRVGHHPQEDAGADPPSSSKSRATATRHGCLRKDKIPAPRVGSVNGQRSQLSTRAHARRKSCAQQALTRSSVVRPEAWPWSVKIISPRPERHRSGDGPRRHGPGHGRPRMVGLSARHPRGVFSVVSFLVVRWFHVEDCTGG